jgi:hypothetical protein
VTAVPIRQSLFLVQFPTSAPVCQVDDFPRGTARSVEGALYVRPGGTKKITKTELDHLKQNHPWGRLIRVVKKVAPPPLTSATPQSDVKAAKAKEQSDSAARMPKTGGTKKTPKRIAGQGGVPE